MKICVMPRLSTLGNASNEPSGNQSGRASSSSPVVICCRLLPLKLIVAGLHVPGEQIDGQQTVGDVPDRIRIADVLDSRFLILER